jgi:hypothetical protein
MSGQRAEPFGREPRQGHVGLASQAADAPGENMHGVFHEANDKSFPDSDPPARPAAPTGEEVTDPVLQAAGWVGLGRVVWQPAGPVAKLGEGRSRWQSPRVGAR